MRLSGGGGEEPTSAASPAELQKAGAQFRTLANACGGLAESPDLQAGGQYELAAVQFVGGVGSHLQLPSAFTEAVETVTQGFLGAMISAQQQFADAAMDLFQVAGDFRTADGQIPSDAQEISRPPDMPAGITAYQTPSGKVWFKDRDGTVVNEPNEDGMNDPEDDTNNPYEQIVGQTYRPATAK